MSTTLLIGRWPALVSVSLNHWGDGPMFTPANKAGGVAIAQVGVGYLDGRLVFDVLIRLGVPMVRLGNALACDGRDLVGDAQDRKAVRAVRSHLRVQDCVAQVVGQGCTDGGLVVQHQDAVVVFAKSKLQRRADHARRLDAPDPGPLEGLHLARARTEQLGARPGEGDLLARRNVWRAADYGRCPSLTGVHRRQAETVRVGVLVNLKHVPDDDLLTIPVAADGLDFTNLDSGHGELVGQLMRRIGDGYVLLEPRDGY